MRADDTKPCLVVWPKHLWQQQAMEVKRLVDELYQPGSHRYSLRNIHRTRIVNRWPISLRTFQRWMRFAIALDGYVGNGPHRVWKNRRTADGNTE